MKWDISSLGKCITHGHHAGKDCPLCDQIQTVVLPPVETQPAIDKSKWFPGPEKELHELFALAMIRMDVRFIHARTDQKSTITKGWPDFSCFKCGEDSIVRACFVELKNRHGRTSKDQDQCIADLIASGIPVIVTGDFREATDFVKTNLKITP